MVSYRAMRFGPSKKLAAGIGAAALLSGGAGAFAATQLGSNPRQAYINDVASRLHVTPTALTSAMKAARIDQISAAEKAGKLTPGQANAAKSRIRSGQASGGAGGPGFFGKPGPGGGFGPGAVKSPHGGFACAAPPMQTTTTGTGTTSTSTTKTFKSAPRCCRRPPNGPGASVSMAGLPAPGRRCRRPLRRPAQQLPVRPIPSSRAARFAGPPTAYVFAPSGLLVGRRARTGSTPRAPSPPRVWDRPGSGLVWHRCEGRQDVPRDHDRGHCAPTSPPGRRSPRSQSATSGSRCRALSRR